MTDVARIGFAADTTDLVAAQKQLEKLSVEAAKAEVAARKLEKAQTSASLAAARVASIEASAAAAVARGSKTMSAAEKQAAADSDRMATAALKAAQAADAQAMASIKAAQAALQQSQAAQTIITANQAAADSAQGLAVANDNAMRAMGRTAGVQQANMTNIAAQFQDIGVTAAMGMNPLMIGLQQGAQLTGVWGSITGTTSEKLATFASSLKAVLSPMSLVIIGLTAGLAALIQFVDWTDLAKSALYGLANGLEAIGPYALAAGAALTLAFAPQIIGAIVSMTAAIVTGLIPAIWSGVVALGAFMLANPFTLIAAGLVALGVLMYNWSEGTQKTFKDTAEFIIDIFIAGYRGIGDVWKDLPAMLGDITISAANNVIKYVNRAVEEAIIALNPMLMILDKLGYDVGVRGKFSGGPGPIANPFAGTANKVDNTFANRFAEARKQDNLGGIQTGIKNFFSGLAEDIRGFAKGIGAEEAKKKKDGAADKAAKGGETNREKFLKLMATGDEAIAKAEQEAAMIGMVGEEAKRTAATYDLLNQAKSQGINLAEADFMAQLKAKAALIATAQQVAENNKFYDEQSKALKQSKADLEIESATLGMTTKAAALYRYEQELINDANARGIPIDREKIAALVAEKDAQLGVSEALDKHAKAVEFDRDATRGFLGDLKSGLTQGKSIWESWGNAVLNVLNKVVDKLLNDVVDAMFQVNQASGGGGIIGSISKLLGVANSAAGASAAAIPSGYTSMVNTGTLKAAKGGVFTNSIVNQPTQFYAKGGTPGVMGEAGPEAIIPLQRGPDGSLGVQMYGGSGSGPAAPAVVHVVPSPYFDVVVDDRAAKVATPMVVQGSMAATKVSEVNSARSARRRIV